MTYWGEKTMRRHQSGRQPPRTAGVRRRHRTRDEVIHDQIDKLVVKRAWRNVQLAMLMRREPRAVHRIERARKHAFENPSDRALNARRTHPRVLLDQAVASHDRLRRRIAKLEQQIAQFTDRIQILRSQLKGNPE